MVSCCITPTGNMQTKTPKKCILYAFRGRRENAYSFWLRSVCVPIVGLFLDVTGSVTVERRLVSAFGRRPDPTRHQRPGHGASEWSPWIRTGLYR